MGDQHLTTTLAPAEIEALLTGQHVKLYPFNRRYFPPETMATLWHTLKSEGADRKVFWNLRNLQGEYDPTGDLVNFCRMFAPEQEGSRHLLVAQSQAHPDQIAGMFWFDDFVPGLRANGSVFYRRRFWGAAAREASYLACRYGIEVLGYPELWAITPWREAWKHAESVGFQIMARLPGYVLVAGEPKDLLVLRLRSTDLKESA